MTQPLSVQPEAIAALGSEGLATVKSREKLRKEARAKLGVTGDDHTAGFREVVRSHNLSYYPVVALGLLLVADQFQGYAFTVLAPEISSSLGVSIGAIAASIAIQRIMIAVAPLPVAALTQHRNRRALLCIVTGLAWSVITLLTGFITSLAGLIVILCLDGLSTGSVTALHAPLLVDSYHPQARVRALSWYQAFGSLGNVLSPALVGILAGLAGFTWRGVFICMGVVSIGLSLISIGLRDPGFGRWDAEELRASVRETQGDSPTPSVVVTEGAVALGFWEICRRVLLIPSTKRLFAGFAVLGVLTIPLATFISYFLDQRWHFGPGERGLFFAYSAATGAIALLVYGRRGEKRFRQSPARVVEACGHLLAGAVILVAVGGLIPWLAPMLMCFGLAGALVVLLQPLLAVTILSLVPADMRPHTQALVGIFLATGGVLGALLLNSVQDQYGPTGTMVSVALFGVIGSLIIASAGRLVEGDLDRMIDEVIEEEEVQRLARSGRRPPMLVCRGIDFSYGQLQVLFGVDFTVEEGAMVALLGVNGAGKSTLLKVISGTALPSGGSVRYHGRDVTYLDAERRVRLGITQVPGGHAVFGELTVSENLRTYGYTMSGDKKRVDRGIESAFEAFPRLFERRNVPAATLSGGEQQMLGLSKAILLRPRLLLIDELSLGLSPLVVGNLLKLVRQMNAEGTAVVLVEQSVNIALNLVEHAYFMEKGEIRFHGRATELLARDDLLRAVFLDGAGSGR